MIGTSGRSLVLVVDDDVTVRLLGREVLESAGFDCVEAGDGAGALAAFADARPDIVLLDLYLPDTDGIALCATLRGLPGGEQVPVVMVTWAEDLESINRAYEVGATDFVTKPINWTILQHRLRYLLRANQAFTEARRHAEALSAKNAELDAFVYSVSHDLKAPLVTLQGMTSALREDCGDRLDADCRYYLERIQANTTHMERLILDLLTLSRVGREARAPERVDLGEVVDEVLAQMGPALRARGVAIARGTAPSVWGIRVQIEQVWRNLIDNAAKYLGDVAEPRIEIGWVEKDDAVECYVRDNGIGIAPAHHARVFEIFQRLKEVETEGTGVGLAIVKKIVEGAGGRIWVESARGAGATFCFTWPTEAPPAS